MFILMIGIPSWSRIYRARSTYCCDNCGGTIPQGTKYQRHVVRLGSQKGRDPLRNIHVHLDCEAPWYQPDNLTHRLRNLARLPLLAPQLVEGMTEVAMFPPLSVHSAALGTLTWQPGVALAATLQATPVGKAAIAEMEAILGIVLTAFTGSASNKRKAMKVNHLITQLVSEIA